MSAAFTAGAAVAGLALVPFVSSASGAPVSAVTVPQEESRDLVVSLSTETTNTYENVDGLLTLEAFTTPVNFEESEGDWRPIDNELVDSSSTAYEVENAANSFTAKIPADASSTPIRFVVDDEWVTMRMHGLDAAPQVDGTTATFEEVEDADEVTYEVQETGLKESIVLDAPPAEPVSYVYTVSASAGLTPAVAQDGSIEFRQADGSVSVTIPAGHMYDAATPSAAFSESVEFNLQEQDSSWRLDVVPSNEWLQDPARVYPVVIDPSLTNQPVSRDCWMREAQPNSGFCGAPSQYVRVGRLNASDQHRGLLDFNVSAIPASATVTSASVNLYQDGSQTVGSTSTDYALFTAGKAFNGGATWNTSGASGAWTGGNPGTAAYGVMTSSGATSGYKTFGGNVENLIQGWVDGSEALRGLVVKQHNGPANTVLYFVSSSGAANKRPYLNVNYVVPPAISASSISVVPCLGECDPTWRFTTTTTPVLNATVSDPDTSAITGQFQIRNADSGQVVGSSGPITGTQGTPFSWQVPSGVLADETVYELRVSGSDGQTTVWSEWQQLGVGLDEAPSAAVDLQVSPCVDPCASLIATSEHPVFSASVDDEDSWMVEASFELREDGA